jgi:pimeloyl-ACP methyl ester carboxylesterase
MNPAIEAGVPVVFLHPFPFDSSVWSETVRSVSDRETLAPDFPGFGGMPPGPVTMDHFARTVLDEMDVLGWERAVFVGLSMGGYVALQIHALAPERVAGLVLADTRAGADDEEGAERRKEQAARAQVEGVDWMPEVLLPKLLGETTRRERPDVVERVRRLMLMADPEGVARALHAMRGRPDSTAHLTAIQVRVLALVGEEDTLTPPEEARRIAEGVPNGTLQVIPSAGHLSNLENPSAFDEALRGFLG